MRYFVFVLAIILVFPAVLAAEATVAACPTEIPLKTSACADGSVVSCQPVCDTSTGQITDCALPACPQPTQIAPAETASEQVKCVFLNSDSAQECYSEIGSRCSGIGSCTAEVTGVKDTKLTWKSSCGGYAYTVIDGNNEDVRK